MENVSNDFLEILREKVIITCYGDEEREELNYADVFYPELEILLGFQNILKVLGGKISIKEAFLKRGFNSEEFETIAKSLCSGYRDWKENPTEENLYKKIRSNNRIILKNVSNLRKKIKEEGEDISSFDKRLLDVMENNNNILCKSLMYSLNDQKLKKVI